jgi:hypothetical protein
MSKPFSVEILIEQTRAVEAGARHAMAGEPKSSETQLSRAELEIVDEARNYAVEAAEKTRQTIDSQLSSVPVMSIEAKALEIEGIKRACLLNSQQHQIRAKDSLFEAWRLFGEHKKALENFRIHHRRTEPPFFQPIFWKNASLLIVIMTFEILANGILLGMAMRGGYLEGWLVAAVISFVVVGFGFLAGLAIRWVYFVRWRWLTNSLGLLGFIVATFVAFAGALFAAHYRAAADLINARADQLAATAGSEGEATFATNPALPESVTNIAYETFTNAPLGFGNSGAALVLVGLSLIIIILAIAKGYYWSDPYPGYTRRAANLHDARRTFNENRDQLISEWRDEANTATKQLSAIAKELSDAVSKGAAVNQTLNRLYLERDDRIDAATTACRGALRGFREANTRVRSQSNPPSLPPVYFMDEFEGFADLKTKNDPLSQIIEANGKALTGLADKLDAAKQEVHKALDDRINGLEDWLAGIKQEAEQEQPRPVKEDHRHHEAVALGEART